jgi:hypothetical protein
MTLLYLLGGRQRKLLFKNEEEQRLYEAAILLLLDTATGKATVELEYKEVQQKISEPRALNSSEASASMS